MNTSLSPEEIKKKILNTLKIVSGNDFPESDIKDNIQLVFFGIDDLDLTHSLPWQLQQEFDILIGDLRTVETFGELVEYVETELKK